MVEIVILDADDPPEIRRGSKSAFTYPENGTHTLYTYRATDQEKGPISWSLAGPDNDDFSISETGVLSFAVPPDFENPTDADQNNTYEIEVVATDDQDLTDSVDVTVTVVNDDEGVEPTISTRRPPSTYRENRTSTVYTFRASDPQRSPITWSHAGVDGGDFTLTTDGSGRGMLTFSNVPDFEDPRDADQDNAYELSVTAEDEDGHRDRLYFTISVTDVNEGPEVSGSARITIRENERLSNAVYTAVDPEGGTVTRWTVGGRDAGDFTIDETGVLAFRKVPDYEKPADANRDNIYEVQIRPYDGRVYGAFDVTVTVEDVNEPPTITTTSTSATELRQDENRTSRLLHLPGDGPGAGDDQVDGGGRGRALLRHRRAGPVLLQCEHAARLRAAGRRGRGQRLRGGD